MFMIAGPNGAGKTTLYRTRIQPHSSAPFINADIIQRDELQDASMTASYKAAEIAEARRREHLAKGKSFVTESTFSHRSKLQLVDDAKAAGFRVVIFHVNVRSPDLSVRRVEERYSEGGHPVPEDKVRERYERNPAFIRKAVLQSDWAYVYDNSALNEDPKLHVVFKVGQVIEASESMPGWARALYGDELASCGQSRAPVTALKSVPDDVRPGDKHATRPTDRGLPDVILPGSDGPLIGAMMNSVETASALRKLGGAAVGRLALPVAGTNYHGRIIQVSDTHVVQQVRKHFAIAHDLSIMSNSTQLLTEAAAGKMQGKTYDFWYDGAGGTGSVASVPAVDGESLIQKRPSARDPDPKIRR